LDYPAEYVAARAVLLDALQALRDHLPAIIVVGAQAVYLHAGSGDFVEPAMTTDADLALDVTSLGTKPEITGALANAGFTPGTNPGSWLGKGGVAVDIMVVPSQSGRTKRTARAPDWRATPTGLHESRQAWNPLSSITHPAHSPRWIPTIRVKSRSTSLGQLPY
jgi:hypothetical protein